MLTSRHQDGHHRVATTIGRFAAPAGLITLGVLPVLAVAVIPVLAWAALFALALALLHPSRG